MTTKLFATLALGALISAQAIAQESAITTADYIDIDAFKNCKIEDLKSFYGTLPFSAADPSEVAKAVQEKWTEMAKLSMSKGYGLLVSAREFPAVGAVLIPESRTVDGSGRINDVPARTAMVGYVRLMATGVKLSCPAAKPKK